MIFAGFAWLAASPWVYAIIFLGMFLEANLTVLTGVFFASQGALNTPLTAIVIIGGAFAEQFFYFYLGRLLTVSGRLTQWVQKIIGRYDHHIIGKTFRALLLSKFVYGFHRLVLTRCGMLKLPTKKFLFATLPATGCWLLILTVAGLLCGASYLSFKRWLGAGEIALLALLLGGLGLEYRVSKKLRRDF